MKNKGEWEGLIVGKKNIFIEFERDIYQKEIEEPTNFRWIKEKYWRERIKKHIMAQKFN
jgi:hypothetical protein